MAGENVARKLAVKYVEDVKRTFHYEPEKYDEFIQILRDVRAHRVDEDGGKARVKELMKGNPSLLIGFNAFFPGAEITIPPEVAESVESDARNFFNKLKIRSQGDDGYVLKSYLEILKMYKEGKKSPKEVQEEVFSLLRNHNDLIEDFSRYLGTQQIIPPEQPSVSVSDGAEFCEQA